MVNCMISKEEVKKQKKRFEEEFGKCEVEVKEDWFVLKAGKYERRIEYNEDGNVSYVRNYKDSKLHGKATRYYGNEKVEWECNYKDGVHHGKDCVYCVDGKIGCEGNYKDGLKDGKWRKYCYKNGNIEREECWKNEMLNGKQIFYNKDGSVKSMENYKDGERIDITSKADTKKMKVRFEEARFEKETGLRCESVFISDRNLLILKALDSICFDSQRFVKYTRQVGFHKNGNVSFVNNYRYGKRHGRWIFYDKDGKFESVEYWEYGRRIG